MCKIGIGVPKLYEFNEKKISNELAAIGYKKLIAQCDKDNIGSYRVMEKIGMTLFSNDGVRFNKCEPNVPKTELMYTMDL